MSSKWYRHKRTLALKARIKELEAALREIYDEATGDKDWDVVETAARDALEEVE